MYSVVSVERSLNCLEMVDVEQCLAFGVLDARSFLLVH